MKVFRIETSIEDFFVKYLLVLNEIFKLSRGVLEVFAQLLYFNDKYKDADKEDRDAMVFSTATRKRICKNLGMTAASLDNHLLSLRKRGLIKKSSIVHEYEIFYDTHKDLGFVFRIKEDESAEPRN